MSDVNMPANYGYVYLYTRYPLLCIKNSASMLYYNRLFVSDFL